jgi:hypothetical protein
MGSVEINLVILVIRTDSDVIAKMRGTFQERPKRVPTEVKKKKKKDHSSASIRASNAGGSGGVSDAPPNQVRCQLICYVFEEVLFGLK